MDLMSQYRTHDVNYDTMMRCRSAHPLRGNYMLFASSVVPTSTSVNLSMLLVYSITEVQRRRPDCVTT
jgi:hypothetical protein